jgi:UDP-N-acetylmuramate dehydrogenase
MIIRRDACLSSLTYYRTGGTCAFLYEPSSLQDLQAALNEIARNGLPFFVLGRGSNSVVLDEPWPGAVVVLRGMNSMRFDGQTVSLDAGVENSAAAEFIATHSLTGAEWLYRLPGEIGATVRMNARCYGGEMSQITARITAITRDGQLKQYPAKEVFRGYKDTIFMVNGEIVAVADIVLRPGEQAAIRSKMVGYEKDRTDRHQFAHPSCGCVFKNDYGVGVPSGRLLEAAGVKGLSCGDAVISAHHANFIFNTGRASARDILDVALAARDAVYKQFGVWLSFEMEVLGALDAQLHERLAEKKPAQLKNHAIAALRGNEELRIRN